MAPRLAVFDFHNTLFHADSWFQLETRHLASAVAEHLAELGHISPLSAVERSKLDNGYRQLRIWVHDSGVEMRPVEGLLELLKQVGVHAEAWTVLRSLNALEQACLASAYAMRGAHRCLARLAEAGITMAVLSSALYTPFLLWSLDRYGLLPFFRKVLTSADAGYYKSDPRLFEALLDGLGVQASEAVHVGDSYRFDVEGAKRAGLRAIWLNRSADGPHPGLADAVVASLEQVPEAIASLWAVRGL